MYDWEKHKELQRKVKGVKQECLKVVVGEESATERILIGLLMKTFSGPKFVSRSGEESGAFGGCGHVLMNAVPGTAKTLLAKVFPMVLEDLKTSRVQMTPDLQPADIVGTDILDEREREFVPKPGPVYTNILLADEMNRTLPKTQSALIEVAGEGQFATVGIREKTFYLEPPFLMVATQNPLEQEGVSPLPEAILDRFAMEIFMSDALQDRLVEIGKTVDKFDEISVKKRMTREEIEETRSLVHKNIYIDERIWKYASNIIVALRYKNSTLSRYILDLEKELELGPEERLLNDENQYRRAIIFFGAAGKVIAFLRERNFVTFADIDYLALDILRVRVVLNKAAARSVIGNEISHWEWVPKTKGGRKIYSIEPVTKKPIANIRQLVDQLCLRAIRGAKEL